MTSPLLSIVIPTYKRADYLALTLEQLRLQVASLPPGKVEILVSDNASPDATPDVVAAAEANGLVLRSIRNSDNIGSDANIAQVFNLATGKYVLILGDDDIPLPSAMEWVLEQIETDRFGVIFLRPYGYSVDFQAEFPGSQGDDYPLADAGEFLRRIGPYLTLISSSVINKQLLASVDAQDFCGGNLVQVHLVLQAMLASRENLYSTHYRVACKRNNSGGYDRSKVFVFELGRILDLYRPNGLTDRDIARFETAMMLGFHPRYLRDQRRDGSGDIAYTYRTFADRYGRRPLFWIWLAPSIRLPRPLALAWGSITNAAGRVMVGDLRRGLAFLRDRFRFGREAGR